jgi:hypothetical protein
VITDADVVDRQHRAKVIVHRLDYQLRLSAGAHIRLVGRDDHAEAGVVERAHLLSHAWEQLEFAEGVWRVRLAITNGRTVDDAVAVEKHRAREGVSFSRYDIQAAAAP